MPSLTALIADDEALLASDLADRLAALWPELRIIGVAKNGIEAIAQMNQHQPDFAFLDIRMPGLTGLQVASSAQTTRVIFVTAFDEYAVQAFENSAVDYLLKPVSDARLAQCVVRLQQRNHADLTKLAQSMTPATATPYLQWLTSSLGETTRLIAIEEVRYFQATEKYTEVVTAHGRHLIRSSLKELLPQLNPQRFAQIHRSYIVCLPAVAKIERDILGRHSVYLKDCADVLPLSRSHAAQFKQM